MSDRISIFGDQPDVDLTAFKPKKPDAPARPAPAKVREVSEAASFPSREAPPPPPPAHVPRRHRTGRTSQLNVRVTPEYFAKAYAIADAQRWLVGETIERALDALSRELKTASSE